MVTPRFLIYISVLIVVTFFGLIKFKRITLIYKLLGVLVLFTLFNESSLRFLNLSNATKIVLYQLAVPVTLLLNTLIYFYMKELKKIKYFVLIIGVASVFVSVLNSVFYQVDIFPSHSVTILCINLIFFSLLTLKEMISIPVSERLFKNSEFWFSISNLFFYTITFSSFLLFNYYSDVSWINNLNYIANLLLYVGYFLAIYFNSRKYKQYE